MIQSESFENSISSTCEKRVLSLNAKPGILALCSVLFMILVYLPVETYASNIADFTYDLADLLKVMIPLFFLCFAAFAGAMVLASRFCRKLYRILEGICFVVLIGFTAEKYLLSGRLPSMDGSEINWSNHRILRLLSIIIWVLITVSVFLIYKPSNPKRNIIDNDFEDSPIPSGDANASKPSRSEKIVRTVSFILLAFMILSCILSCLGPGITADKESVLVTSDGMNDISSDESFFILLLDMVDSPGFTQYLDSHPDVEEMLGDFTYYPDTVGAYPYTLCSVPYIFSGEWYEYQGTYAEYLDSAFSGSDFFRELERREYTMGFYEDEAVPLTADSVRRFDNIIFPAADRFAEPWKFISMQLHFSGYMLLPFDLKRFCALTPDNIYFNSTKEFGDAEMYDSYGPSVYKKLSEGFTLSVGRRFTYLHTSGTHPPYDYDANFEPFADAEYEDVLASCFTMADCFLQKLKESGAYDNTVVVIMSDHGGIEDRTHPVLMIKGKGEHHRFIRDLAPVAFGDLQQGFIDLLNGAEGWTTKYPNSGEAEYLKNGRLENGSNTESIQTDNEGLFPYTAGTVRPRRFLSYRLLSDPMEEMFIE